MAPPKNFVEVPRVQANTNLSIRFLHDNEARNPRGRLLFSMIPRLCSRSNSRYSFPFNATGTRLRGWFILPQTEHLFPNAEQLFLAAGCFPPQNLHLSTSLGLESLAFRSSFSRLLFADLSWLLLADTLPRLVWSFNEFTASPSSQVLAVFSTTRLLHKCWGIFVNQDLGS